jgi:hypothetical protein
MEYKGPNRSEEQWLDGLTERLKGGAEPPEEIKELQSAGKQAMLRLADSKAPENNELSSVESVQHLQDFSVDRNRDLDPRLISLVETIDALPEAARQWKGKVRTGAEVARAIPNVEAFLSELATLKKGEFWELNEQGQLVMGDGCAEPARKTFGPTHEGLNYHQSRTLATRKCYFNAEGKPVVLEGDDKKIPSGAKVLSERGLVTLEEYKRKNKGRFERKMVIWTESGKNPFFVGDACWRGGRVLSRGDYPSRRYNYKGSRRVLRVNLNFES